MARQNTRRVLELLLLVLVAFLVVAAVGGGAWGFTRIPFGRWSFTHEGRSFEVVNYAFHEHIFVDGERLRDTRVGGDHLTHAAHAIRLPDGQQLDVVVGSANGLTVACVAKVGDAVVFDSNDLRPAPGTARAVLPPGRATAVTSEAVAVPDDARWAAAAVLLDELGRDPDHSDASEALRGALRDALTALETAQRAAVAHQALGGEGGPLDAIVAHREGSVVEVLDLVRQLHVVAATKGVTEDLAVEATLARVQAEREVDEEGLRQAMARRSRQHEG